MRTTTVTLYSDRLKLEGAFLHADDDRLDEKRPLVIIMSGFTGLRTIHPSRFARVLTTRGQRCFSFDYRGFANSEGARGHLLLEDQVRDVRNAVSFVRSFDFVADDAIALVGWAMGAGVVLKAAHGLPGIRTVCGINGFYDGRRFLRQHLGGDGLAAYERRVDAARRTASRTARWPDAEAFEIYPLDPSSAAYVNNQLRTYAHYFDHRFSLAMADSLLNWKPEALAPCMTAPLWLAHGLQNELHAPVESKSLYGLYKGEKHHHCIEGAGHTEWMFDDNPIFRRLAAALGQWLSGTLR